MCLIRVHDGALYTQGGFECFEDYLGRKGVRMAKTTAYRLMDLSRNFSRFIARKHGQTKLIAAIDLAKATPEDDKPVDVLAYRIEVRDAKGQVSTRTSSQASVREINNAAKLHIQTGKGRDPEIALTLSNIPQSKLRQSLERIAQAVPES